MNYKTPGVKIKETRRFPPSVAAVETAIPVFIGYTERAIQKEADDLLNVPYRITSLLQYEKVFGTAMPEQGVVVNVDTKTTPTEMLVKVENPSNYKMYYALQAFYGNGGGPCWITSIGTYSEGSIINLPDLQEGLARAGQIDEITLLLFPDAQGLSSETDFYGLQKEALDQCRALGDRFAILDVFFHSDTAANNVQLLRDTLSGTIDDLKYGAVYYPNLEMSLDYAYEPDQVQVVLDGEEKILADLEQENNVVFNQVKNEIGLVNMNMPPSPAVAGIYAQVDNARGVWKAPANINIDGAVKPTVTITNQSQRDLNVDSVAGKSINAIRSFTGRGPAIIWGSRTLAGNDNEWRYVPVRRFFNMVEESVKNATEQFVFEPNDENTWTLVKSMIENFLVLQWRARALMGATPEEAFFVRVGLNETMTELDVWEGRMIVQIGMAVVRPAEFIILEFMHKMLSES